MNKKHAQQMGGQQTIDVKQQELQKIINNTLSQLGPQLQQLQQKVTQELNQKINQIMQDLNKEVTMKINEIKSLPPGSPGMKPVSTPTADLDLPGVIKESYHQGGGGVNDPKSPKSKSKEKTPPHPTARGDGEETPMYWKRNFDYGEGPYQNLEKMKGKKITDYEDTLIPDGRYKNPKKRRKK